MFSDDIPFKLGNISNSAGVFQGDCGVHTAVRGLTLGAAGVIHFPVVIEQVMKQTGTGSRTGIEPEKSANHIAVVGDIEAMLETGGTDMVSDIFQPAKFGAGDDIANAIVKACVRQFLAGAYGFQHNIKSLSGYSELSVITLYYTLSEKARVNLEQVGSALLKTFVIQRNFRQP